MPELLKKYSPAEILVQLEGKPTGTTLFCHNPRPLSCKTIRLGLDSYWDHTATYVRYQEDTTVVFPDGNVVTYLAGDYIVEAKGGETIHAKPLAEWLAKRQDNHFGISWPDQPVPLEKIHSQFGKHYDYGAVFVPMVVYRLTGHWVGPTSDRAQRLWFCFELSAWYRGVDGYWCKVPDGEGGFKYMHKQPPE